MTSGSWLLRRVLPTVTADGHNAALYNDMLYIRYAQPLSADQQYGSVCWVYPIVTEVIASLN